ncbi:unnamed protein product [Phytomonas sp. Hart1]|nr:unnamed protein product [Phytomonas sp. Hart1]|eukprot:CCW67350.1 unnamed protein product [Phytomonas sp. isolate Hart1]
MLGSNAEESDCLIIRTELIEALLKRQKYGDSVLERSQTGGDVQGSDTPFLNGLNDGSTTAQCPSCEDYGVCDGGLIEQFVRVCPPLGVPSWAMEECLRISPKAETWYGTALHPKVWGLPGTAQCTFMTQPSDFLNFLVNE